MLPETVRHTETLPPLLLRLLEEYPWKTYQNNRLGLDRSGLARYQWDLAQKMDLQQHPFYTGCGASNSESFCFGLRRHDWHSEFFGVRIARVSHLLFSDESEAVRRSAVHAVLAHGRQEDIRLLQVRVDVQDRSLLDALVEHGFRTIGHSVKLAAVRDQLDRLTACPDNLNGESLRESANPAAGHVRPFVQEDLEPMQAIARRSHQQSHFFNDPKLKQRAADGLFARWLEKCAGGAAAQILVIEGEHPGRPVGFITLLLNRRLSDYCAHAAGVVDFIAIDPDWQGRGFGGKLLDAGLQWLTSRSGYVEIRTELDNYPAIRLYQRRGLELLSSDVELHHWNP